MALEKRYIPQYNDVDLYRHSPQESKEELFFDFDAVMGLLTERKLIVREQERRQINRELQNDPRGKWFKTPPPLHAFPETVLKSDEMLEEKLKKIEEELGKYSCM